MLKTKKVQSENLKPVPRRDLGLDTSRGLAEGEAGGGSKGAT